MLSFIDKLRIISNKNKNSNTLLLSFQIRPEFREFSLGVATIADSFGISIAGVVTIPSHNHICSLHLKVL
jgi:hypothetical protein